MIDVAITVLIMVLDSRCFVTLAFAYESTDASFWLYYQSLIRPWCTFYKALIACLNWRVLYRCTQVMNFDWI